MYQALQLLKALAILSAAIVRRSSVHQEGLKNYTGNHKKGQISLGDQQAIFYKFFKDSPNHRKKTYWVAVFSHATFPSTFLKIQ